MWPIAHAGADLQAFLIFCFKPILISAHKLTLLIYGDNTAALCALVTRDQQYSLAKVTSGSAVAERT